MPKSAKPYPPVIVTHGKTEVLMPSLASASNALPRVATGPLLVYETYVSPGPLSPSATGTSLTIPSQEFLFYYEKWEPPKSKNGERARSVTRTRSRVPIVV